MADVLEGDKVQIETKVDRGGVDLLSFFRDKKTLKATYDFTLTEGAASTLAQMVVEVKDSQESVIKSDVITLPDVKPAFDYYDFKYHVTTKIGEKTNPKEAGTFELRVWPTSVTVKTVFNDGGAKAPEFEFVLTQSDKILVKAAKTDAEGEYAKPLKACGSIGISAISPWILNERVDPKAGRVWDLKVTKKPWKAKIHSPAGGKTPEAHLKQLVNQTQDFATNCGSWVKLELGPEDLELGKQDEEIKVRVTFPAENSLRNNPKPGLWTGAVDAKVEVAAKVPTAEPGKAELVYEAVVKLPADKAKVVCFIQMGSAGGDRCKVEVGVTDKYSDDVLHIANWRRIGAELIIPRAAMRQPCPALLDPTKAELGSDLVGKLKALLDASFIAMDFPATKAHLFEASDIDGVKGMDYPGNVYTDIAKTKGTYLVVDAAKFANWVLDPGWWPWDSPTYKRKPLTGKVFIASYDLLDKLRKKVTDAAALVTPGVEVLPKDTLTIRWCDFLANQEKRVDFKPTKKMNFLTRELESLVPIAVDPLGFHLFEHDPIAADGTPAVREINWKVFKVRKQGTSAWQNPPGWVDKKDWVAAPAASTADVAKYVTIQDSNKITLTLPNADPSDPGKFLTQVHKEDDGPKKNVDVTYECQIQLEILAVGLNFNVLGSALQGVIGMTTQAGLTTDHGAAHTVVHELGHNLGQAYLKHVGPGEMHATPAGSDDRGRSSTNEISGLPFANTAVPNGAYFAGKGYAGAHCATAIKKKVEKELAGPTKAAQRKAVFDEPDWRSPSQANRKYFQVNDEDHCIMFATTDNTQAKAKSFCEDCAKYVKATDADDVTKSWMA